ncbi:hypothetical protein [Vibrio alginolyticus]|uniref:hypothetical protein n=1 Tax=Vibrio alginolyticus TaxID=663 RepID=UPI0015F74036|nr:hypothetical protein [Vibrio alginolyticus]EJE4208737.1 hypothetical protein [Vibrio parahaemolyticus]
MTSSNVAIRHRYHYGSIIINPAGVVMGSSSITGNSIPALKLDGSRHYLPFGGIVDDKLVLPAVQRVKLVNITALWFDEFAMGPPIEIPIGHAIKGFLIEGRYMIAINENRPLHWKLEVQDRKPNDNVVNIFTGRRRQPPAR